jgi:hypothetical protein
MAQSNNSKSAIVDLVKTIVAVTALPLTVYTVTNNFVEKPGITLVAALITALLASALVVRYQNVRIDTVITAWLMLIVAVIAVWILWPKTVTIKGIIVDGANNPVLNEEVKLIDANGSLHIADTGNTGHYQFKSIPNGQYKIMVRGNRVEGLAQSGFVLVLSLNLMVSQSPTPTPTPACSQITAFRITSPDGLHDHVTTQDVLPHFARTVKVSWEPPYCEMIIQFLQGGNVKFDSGVPVQSGLIALTSAPSLGWTEIKIWVPGDTSGKPADNVHVAVCDPASDPQCRTN